MRPVLAGFAVAGALAGERRAGLRLLSAVFPEAAPPALTPPRAGTAAFRLDPALESRSDVGADAPAAPFVGDADAAAGAPRFFDDADFEVAGGDAAAFFAFGAELAPDTGAGASSPRTLAAASLARWTMEPAV